MSLTVVLATRLGYRISTSTSISISAYDIRVRV